MKNLLKVIPILATIFLLTSCTKTESDFTEPVKPETITINANALNVTAGTAVSFTVLSSLNNSNVTADSKIYVNGSLIVGASYTFATAGNFIVNATKGAIVSATISINVTAVVPTVTAYKHKVLVEEYSGTWCGNCPRILYGVDLLEQQTSKAIVVSTHLFGNDPFISTDGNSLAAQQSVGGVPTGYINRNTSWTGPQYENVPQVINTIQASSNAGIAISSLVTNNNLSITINAAYAQPLTSGAKLTVYLVEDKLFYTQRNYSANLYGGLANIPNFEYNGVLRKVISTLSGDAIGNTGNTNGKTYSLPIPTNVATLSNARIVAFITNATGEVINVQDAKVGETKMLEVI